MRKRKFNRRTLKKISWIFGRDLPFWGWYDCETDEIPVVIDNFVRQTWQAFREKSFHEFRRIVIKEINHLMLHEIIHYISQPATESKDMDMFPEDMSKTTQENLRIIEYKVDLASKLLAGLIRTNKIPCINIIGDSGTLEELEEELFG